MPTYEYKCLDCGRRFEVFQRMNDDPLTTCDECQGTLKRLIGAGAGILFKGSGFYCTDYRSSSYSAAAKKEKSSSESGGSSESKGASGTDSKTKKTDSSGSKTP